MSQHSAAPAVPGPENHPDTPDTPAESPWAESLLTRFEDPEQRASVDAYLRETVQPYVTKLESERGAPEATEFYSQFQEDPVDAHLRVTEELYGAEARAAVESALFEAEEAADASPDPEAVPTARDPEIQALLDEREEERRNTAYREILDELKAKDTDLIEDEFHPFVFSADGDVNKAYEEYGRWREGVKQRYSPAPVEPDPAPAVLGSQGTPGPAPATTPQGETLEESIDGFMASLRAEASQ